MSLNISNKLMEPSYEEKLKKILELIIPTNIFDFNKVKWVLYATNRSLNNTNIYTELFDEITGQDIACCDIYTNTIKITNYTLKQSESFIIEVILHELAHIISKEGNHNNEFNICFNNLIKNYNKKSEGIKVGTKNPFYDFYIKKGILER